jgi:RecA-family ATPase
MRDPLLVLALASAATLSIALSAACTAVEPYRAAGAMPTRTASTLYCWKDRLTDDSDKLVCNWAESRYDACRSTTFSSIDKKHVAGAPTPVTRCENGQSLVSVTLS